MLKRTLLPLAVVATAIAVLHTGTSAQDANLVHVASDLTYNLRTEDSPVNVTWQILVENNDPSTAPSGNGESLVFYTNIAIPVLRGADGISAVDSHGQQLDVAIDQSSDAPIITATIEFADRLFYEDSYALSVRYDLPPIREESVLVTPAYIFLPVVASGDEAKVTVITPDPSEWETILEEQDCARDGNTFTCSGSEDAYIVATAESSQPGAIESLSIQADLEGRAINVEIVYFQGEEPTAAHLGELIPASLAELKDLFGFPYDGPGSVTIAQGGRQAILGYEGLTDCSSDGCRIIISPVADDATVIHELAHLWTSVFSERWLVEGYAELYAEEAADRLPSELITSPRQPSVSSAVDLQLDEWGDVISVIEAAEEQIALESAGYDLSLRFLKLLGLELGDSVLRDVNVAIAESGTQADSRVYMDMVEDISGRNVDRLFRDWVFAEDQGPLIDLRRLARDRLAELETRALVEDLPGRATDGIRDDILAWDFAAAISKLDTAESDIGIYRELSEEIGRLTSEASAVGLTLPPGIASDLDQWEFGGVRLALADAGDAIDAFSEARERVNASRSLWQRFGLLGSDPDGQLEDAEAFFEAGQFQASIDSARAAEQTIADASTVALRRVLVVAGIFAAFGLIVLAAVWASHLRERGLADH